MLRTTYIIEAVEVKPPLNLNEEDSKYISKI